VRNTQPRHRALACPRHAPRECHHAEMQGVAAACELRCCCTEVSNRDPLPGISRPSRPHLAASRKDRLSLDGRADFNEIFRKWAPSHARNPTRNCSCSLTRSPPTEPVTSVRSRAAGPLRPWSWQANSEAQAHHARGLGAEQPAGECSSARRCPAAHEESDVEESDVEECGSEHGPRP